MSWKPSVLDIAFHRWCPSSYVWIPEEALHVRCSKVNEFVDLESYLRDRTGSDCTGTIRFTKFLGAILMAFYLG
jgi:hypothetical protein